MKDAEQLKELAKAKGIRKWFIRPCSICEYPLGYVFSLDYETVGYDTGCNCTTYNYVVNRSSWEELAHDFNRAEHPETIKQRNECWGIDD